MKNLKKASMISIAFIVMAIPHILYLMRAGLCGWDCGWYVFHLGADTYGSYWRATEPLYFWIFKPFVLMGADPLIVMKVSMVAMLLFAMAGMYILAKRLGMNLFEAIVAVAVFTTSAFTVNLWDDTLRNFLSFSLLPYFLYFFFGSTRKDRIISFLMLLLMGLAHRMVMMIFPFIILYRLLKRQWKTLAIEITAVILPLLIFFSMATDKISGLTIYQSTANRFLLQDAIEPVLYNFRTMLNVGLPEIVIAAGLLSLLDYRRWESRMAAGFFVVVLVVSALFSNLLANRSMMIIGLCVAMIAGLALMNVRKSAKPMFLKSIRYGVAIISVIFIVTAGIIGIGEMDGQTSKEELAFIDSIDIPDGSILIVPDRLAFYAKERHRNNEVRFVSYRTYSDRILNETFREFKNQTVDEADVYLGINRFGTDVWYVDSCDHFRPNPECPLELKFLRKDE